MMGETKIFERAMKNCMNKKLTLLERYIEQKFKVLNEKAGKAFLAEYIRFIAANVAYVARTTPHVGRNSKLGAALKRIDKPEIVAKLGTAVKIRPELYATAWASIAHKKLTPRPRRRAKAAGSTRRRDTRGRRR